MIPFIRRWAAGCGFFGEQGGESIHAKFNTLKRNYANIQNKMDARVKKKRNVKRNFPEK